MERRRDIQGLRAVAVLLVVFFHAGLPLPGGFVGVDVFFVISGFVITGMLAREFERSGRIKFREFYARRFKRLTPALALMVTVTVLLSAVFASPLGAQQVTAQTSIGAMLLAANVVIALTTGGYFDAAADTNPLLNTWSLSVEEQFYLFFPLFLLGGWVVRAKFTRGRWVPALLVAAVAVVSLGLMLLTSRGGHLPFISDELVGFYGPLSRAWEFAAGALLALVSGPKSRAPTGPQPGLLRLPKGTLQGITGLAMIVVSLWLIDESVPGPGIRNLVPVIGAVLIIHAGRYPGNLVSRLLATRPFVALGDVSYSWYLWHWPLIVFAVLLWPDQPLILIVVAIISLLPAVASYRWVEQPIRQQQGLTPSRWAKLLSLTLVPPLALSVLLIWVNANGFWSTAILNYQQARTSHADVLTECAAALPVLAPGWEFCRWNTNAQGPPIYLLGDSNAGHFSEAVIEAATALDRPVMIFTVHGCPFMDIREYLSSNYVPQEPGCPEYVQSTLEWLTGQPSGLVILSSSSSPWSPPEFSTIESKPWSMTTVSSGYLESVITKTVRELQDMGNQVLLVMTVPHFSMSPYQLDYSRCSIWDIQGEGCTQWMPQEVTDRAQGDLRAAIAGAAAATGADVLDLRDNLCSHSVCSSRRGELVLYSDGGHLSVAASESLALVFADRINARKS